MKTSAILLTAVSAAMILFSTGCFSAKKEEPKKLTKADIQLEYAVRHSKPAMVKRALQQKADPNTVGKYGRPVLMEAVVLQNAEIIRLLIESGADVNIRDEFGDTPLIAAASSKKTDIPELLLRHKADPNAAGRFKRTPLMEAARLGLIDNVRLFLRCKADPAAKDEYNRTFAVYAALAPENGIELLKLILSPELHVPHPDELDLMTSPLLAAMLRGKPETVEYLLNLIPSFQPKSYQPLGQAAMRIAIEFNHKKWVEIITEKGLDLNRTLPLPFRITIFLNIQGMYKLMARNDIIDHGFTPLIWAAIFKRPEIASYLIEHGARPDIMSNEGQIAIDYANDSATHRAIKNASKAFEEKKKQQEKEKLEGKEKRLLLVLNATSLFSAKLTPLRLTDICLNLAEYLRSPLSRSSTKSARSLL